MMRKFSQALLRTSTIIIFCLALNAYTQGPEAAKKALDSMSLKMFTDMNNRDYEAIVDMTHPKVFEMVPKETMVSVFKAMLEGNEEFSVALPDEIPEYKISDLFSAEEGNANYAFVNYDMKMSMTFHNEGFDEDTKDNMVKMMKMQGMEAEFVSDNTVSLNLPNRITILVNDESTKNKWAMVNYDPNSPLFFQLLSSEIIEKVKAYHQDLMIEQKKKE